MPPPRPALRPVLVGAYFAYVVVVVSAFLSVAFAREHGLDTAWADGLLLVPGGSRVLVGVAVFAYLAAPLVVGGLVARWRRRAPR